MPSEHLGFVCLVSLNFQRTFEGRPGIQATSWPPKVQILAYSVVRFTALKYLIWASFGSY